MAKYGPGEVAFFAIGGFNLLGELTSCNSKISGILEDSRPLGVTWGEHTPVGIRFMELSQSGFYNDVSGQSNDAIVGKQETSVVLSFGVEGNTIGEEMVGAFGVFAGEYNRAQEREGLHKADATYRVTGVVDQHARILHELSVETAASGDTEASSVDGGDGGEHGEPNIPITSSNTSDEITTPVPHGLVVGDIIVITGHSGSTPDINGEQDVATPAFLTGVICYVW